MSLAGFEPAMTANKQLRTYTLERMATVHSASLLISLRQNRQTRSKVI